MKPRALLAAGTAVALVAGLTACAPPREHLTFRLWDPQVAEAYRLSLDAFEDESGIEVDIVMVPWADYWTQLRLDIASGTVDDVFWTNAANFQDYAAAGAILPVTAQQRDDQESGWVAAVVDQYSIDDELWGIPQITDPGIALLYNADLLAEAGLDATDLAGLSWDPSAPDDTLREAARELTLDSSGNHPGEPGFDTDRLQQYGFGAANDVNAVLLQFLAGNGSAWQHGDDFVFADEAGTTAIGYLVDLINSEHVAPNAADTNPPAGGDFVRDQFLQGNVVLFPTGAYNLANVEESADFAWGIAPFPAGPAGALSVTNGVVAAASSSTDDPAGQRALLGWLGSPEGQLAIGSSGAALPACVDAQAAYLQVWADRGVDLSPMLEVLDHGTVQAPQGARYAAASQAMEQTLNDVFLGRTEVEGGLREAEAAGNQAMGD
jgi:multiple sugar transport system substrate-binding protein